MIKQKLATVGASVSGLLAWTTIAAAQVAPTGLTGSQTNLTAIGTAASLTGTNSSSLPALIGRIINVILGLLGIVFVILVIYSGIQYMLSRGEKGKVEDATKNIQTAIIGLVITVGAYAISNYVISALVAATAA